MEKDTARREIVLEYLQRRVRMLVVEDGRICEYVVSYDEAKKDPARTGDVYVGRVVSLVRATQSAFVDIGMEKNAILHVPQGDKALVPGSLVTVQVQREPSSPQKGPRVTQDIQLPGKLCVLSPLRKGVGCSQKIEDEQVRNRLLQCAKAACPTGMGVIVRTLAQWASREALCEEIDALCAVWAQIAQRAKGMPHPGLLHGAGDFVGRLARDLLDARIARIVCDDKVALLQLKAQAPSLADRMEHYSGALPIFDALGLEAPLQKALKRCVHLKSGASLVIDPCEAMTVIDVNSGACVRAKDSEETAFSVNLEAACEIARQLRLRDVGGIVVIDFIDMALPEHKEALVRAFEEDVRADRSRVHVGRLSPLGLLELTRKPIGQGTNKMRCATGNAQNAREQAYDVLLEVRRRAYTHGEQAVYALRAPVRVIKSIAALGERFPCEALYARSCDTDESIALERIIEGDVPAQHERIYFRSEKKHE